MTIASAASAAVFSQPAGAVFRPSTDADDSDGRPFAEQLSGLTDGPESAGAWRSAGPPKTQEKAEAGTSPQTAALPVTVPTVTQAVLATAIHLPFEGFGGSRPGAKHATPGRSSAQAASNDSTQTAAVAVAPVPLPLPQLTTALPPVIDGAVNQDEPAVAGNTAVSRSEPGQAAEPAPNVTAAAGPAQRPQDMAFATRIQPVQSVEQSALPAEMASAAAVASASKKVVEASPDDAHGLLAATTSTLERNAQPAPAALPAATASRSAEAPALVADSLPKASAALKDISLQVTQPGKEPVDVRVVQAGSEVHVSVHSGDAGLTSGLRQGLSDLQSRLEESGYRSEMWRPGASAAPLTPTPSAQASTNHSRGGDGQPQQNGSQQDSGRRNQNQSNQPRWVEELESSLTGGEKSSGGSYGFTS